MKLRKLCVTVGFAILLSVANIGNAASSKPDVLFIFCDQWSVRYTSWDNPQVRTPNLGRIAQEGMIFDAAYSNSPVCMPARVSLLTGLYPHNQGHSLWGNANNYHLPPASSPMFRDIQGAGYTTAQIGKLHWFSGADWRSEFASLDDYHRAMGRDTVMAVNGPPDSAEANDPYCAYLRGKGLLTAVAKDMHDRYLNDQYVVRPSFVGPEDYHDTFVTNEAIEVIRRQPRDEPLCLVLSLHAPHPPLDAPASFATMFDPKAIDLPENVPEQFSYGGQKTSRTDVQRMVGNYLGKMALVDANIGRVIEAMRARGTWDDAFVAFSADHGEMMGAHGHMSKGQMYEESVRVPLVIRWPRHVRSGRTDALAMMFDLYPTIVEAIGGTLTPGRFARSLLPACESDSATVHPLVVSEIGRSTPLDVMVRTKRYKWWLDDDGEFLFDIKKDPLEMHNLAEMSEHRETCNDMHDRLLTFLRTEQVNFAIGSKSKVQRIREKAAKEE